ncbi:hypothetical protein [Thiolapillus sp.]|uniref:hypothetical protein n=1 Tax=Thiolapillus sp. TaxID=2017437 RepID=UPI003AF96432
MTIELSTDQKKAIDHLKKVFGNKWESKLKNCWLTGIYGYGLSKTETAAMQKLHNEIINKELKYYN